jgi:hypothetical protein
MLVIWSYNGRKYNSLGRLVSTLLDLAVARESLASHYEVLSLQRIPFFEIIVPRSHRTAFSADLIASARQILFVSRDALAAFASNRLGGIIQRTEWLVGSGIN